MELIREAMPFAEDHIKEIIAIVVIALAAFKGTAKRVLLLMLSLVTYPFRSAKLGPVAEEFMKSLAAPDPLFDNKSGDLLAGGVIFRFKDAVLEDARVNGSSCWVNLTVKEQRVIQKQALKVVNAYNEQQRLATEDKITSIVRKAREG